MESIKKIIEGLGLKVLKVSTSGLHYTFKIDADKEPLLPKTMAVLKEAGYEHLESGVAGNILYISMTQPEYSEATNKATETEAIEKEPEPIPEPIAEPEVPEEVSDIAKEL